jgi:hypothetical protein
MKSRVRVPAIVVEDHACYSQAAVGIIYRK